MRITATEILAAKNLFIPAAGIGILHSLPVNRGWPLILFSTEAHISSLSL
jgi:hypothetical protein